MNSQRCHVAFIYTVLALAGCGVSAQETNTLPDAEATLAQFGRRDTRVHDPSTIVKCKDGYWVFGTGPGLTSRHSRDLINWTNGPRVITTFPAWITNAVPGNRGSYWAPDVVYLTNRYLLYYSVSIFGKNTSAIALATNPTLDPADTNYLWTDCGPVIQSRAKDKFNCIDPAVIHDTDETLWLVFGSYWSGIKLIQLDPATGKRLAPDSPMYSLAHYGSIEASYIYQHGGHYYLFVNWGQCCRGVNSTYNIRIGRSDKITGPYLDKNGVDLLHEGGSLFLDTAGPFIGPGHAGIFTAGGTNWFSCHFYDGTRRGAPELAIMPLRWSDGWPEVNVPPAK